MYYALQRHTKNVVDWNCSIHKGKETDMKRLLRMFEPRYAWLHLIIVTAVYCAAVVYMAQ